MVHSLTELPTPGRAIPDRNEVIQTAKTHAVLGTAMHPPFPGHLACATFGMGCFWGAEKKFWSLPGVFSTQVGYAAGLTRNPTYKDVCTGLTGHTEVVRVVFDPKMLSFEALLAVFWENHNPTEGMRQGADVGTQYRSGIYCDGPDQMDRALRSRAAFQAALSQKGFGTITTEVLDAGPFYYAEDYHQQYLYKNPEGYCGLGGTGVKCPTGL